jgi:hypothetical protein
LEGAERADNAAYARACLPVLQKDVLPSLTMHWMATWTYGIRYQELWQEPTDTPALNALIADLRRVAGKLPDRACTALEAAASALTSDRAVSLTRGASLADVVRLLEAMSGAVQLTVGAAAELFQRITLPEDASSADLYARLIEALDRCLEPDARDQVLGSMHNRAVIVARADPTITDVVIDESSRTVTATIMFSPHDLGIRDVPIWDTAPHGTSDRAEHAAIKAAERFAAACPEADVFKIVTITASGSRLKINGHAWASVRMNRKAFPDRVERRRNVGFQAAIGRLTAAESWTRLITEHIEISRDLVELLATAPSRLKPGDNSARRRQWTAKVETVRERARALESKPVVGTASVDTSHAHADDDDRQTDKTSDALSQVAQVLARLVTDEHRIGQAAQFRDAGQRLMAARDASDPALAALGRPIPDALINGVDRLARLFMVIHQNRTAATHIRGDDLDGSVATLLADAASRTEARQRAVLEGVVGSITGVELRPVTAPKPLAGAIGDMAWLITAPLDSWDTLVEALRQLSDEDRLGLGCNVVAVPVDNGNLVPSGMQLTHLGEPRELPMTAEMLSTFTEPAGMQLPVRSAPAIEIIAIIDAAIAVSWDVALRRHRRADWPTPPDAAGPHIEELRARAAAATAAYPDAIADIAEHALTVLIDHVDAEIDSTATASLAGEVLDGQERGRTHETSIPHLWDALETITAMLITAVPTSITTP